MSRVAGTPEWCKENLQISYPFVVDPAAESQTEGIRGSIADATMAVSVFSLSSAYSLKVSRTAGVTSVHAYRDAVEIAAPSDFTSTRVFGDLAVTWFSAADTCQGCVTTMASDFAEGTALLLPGRVFPLQSGVTAFTVGEGDPQAGELELLAGNNLQATVSGKTIRLAGSPDAGCSVPGGVEYLATINGVSPDAKGDVRITAGPKGCLSALPHPPGHNIILRNDCGSPSPRKGRAASYEKLLHAAAIYHLVAIALEGVDVDTQEVVDNVTTFISERVEPA